MKPFVKHRNQSKVLAHILIGWEQKVMNQKNKLAEYIKQLLSGTFWSCLWCSFFTFVLWNRQQFREIKILIHVFLAKKKKTAKILLFWSSSQAKYNVFLCCVWKKVWKSLNSFSWKLLRMTFRRLKMCKVHIICLEKFVVKIPTILPKPVQSLMFWK